MTQLDSAALRAANDRSVLVGLLALQLGMATRQQVADTLTTWINDRLRSFDELLRERCRLSEGQCTWLREVAASLVLQHGNDLAACLDALHESAAARSQLSRIVDPEATLDRPNQGAAPEAKRPAAAPASTANRFHCLHEHARGGMGVVYVAEDRELERRIALKEIKADLVSDPHYRDHFEREARITGNLEHPGVVPVYSAGKLPNGNPYYAMRLIRGVSLTKRIDAFHHGKGEFSSSEFRQLLSQFISVCNTVAYAHSKGVLHRDLKPGNIMVGTYGETLVVDWGLARGWRDKSEGAEPTSVLRAATKGTAETEHGAVIGTLSYMSPEQARGRVFGPEPAPDIFCLGATLFQILTGEPPYPHPAKDEYNSTLKRVQNGDFLPPRAICPRIPRPLEAICLKAMAVNYGDRYPSAEMLAADIEKYLADDPVSVYPEPRFVRAMRWMKRHRTAVTVLAVVTVLLVAGLAVHNRLLAATNAQLTQARSQLQQSLNEVASSNQALTEANERLTESNAAEAAARQEAEEVLTALRGCLRRPDPVLDGEKVTVVEVLELLERDLEDTFPDRPRLQVILFNTIGQTYREIGRYRDSAQVHEKALTLATAAVGETDSITCQSMINLAHSLKFLDRIDEAIALYERALATMRARSAPPDNELILAISYLGTAYQAADRRSEALARLQEAQQLMTDLHGAEHPESLRITNHLGSLYFDLGDSDKAVKILERVLKLRQDKLGSGHADTLASLNNLAAVYVQTDRAADAVPLFEQALPLTEKKFGKQHSRTLALMHNLASAYLSLSRVQEAIDLLEPAAEAHNTKFGLSHSNTQNVRSTLAKAYLHGGLAEKAVPLFKDFIAFQRTKLRSEPLNLGQLIMDISSELVAYQQFAEAEVMLREVFAIFSKLVPGHFKTANVQGLLGRSLLAQGKHAEAEPLLIAAYERFSDPQLPQPEIVQSIQGVLLQSLVRLYSEWDKPEEEKTWQKKLDDWEAASSQ